MKHGREGSVHPEGDWREGGFALYVHWPFCQAKCPYCDFNSHVVGQVDVASWENAYREQIDLWASRTKGRVLTSIFFGGGTPSLMAPSTVASVIDAARDGWSFSNSIEITLEANPTSVDAARFKGYALAGVNRLSLGVQSFDDASLKALGRLHSATEARSALDIARATFSRVSFDLIYARQNQSLNQWAVELQSALDLSPDHLSLYQLTIEDGTAFQARHQAGVLRGLPDEDLAADMFELTQDVCSTAGLPAYETSNHARPGSEGRHNLVYWRYGDYLGIGPGAHGRVTLDNIRRSTVQPKMPGTWLQWVSSTRSRTDIGEEISLPDQGRELLMTSLRLAEGVDVERLARFGDGLIDLRRVATLVREDLLWISGGRMGTTQRGRPLLNSILRELI